MGFNRLLISGSINCGGLIDWILLLRGSHLKGCITYHNVNLHKIEQHHDVNLHKVEHHHGVNLHKIEHHHDVNLHKIEQLQTFKSACRR
jgi:hypothetical protein